MKQCPSCGASIPEESLFCTSCGVRCPVPESAPPYASTPPAYGAEMAQNTIPQAESAQPAYGQQTYAPPTYQPYQEMPEQQPPSYQPYGGAPAQQPPYSGQPYGGAPAEPPQPPYSGQPYGSSQAPPTYGAPPSQPAGYSSAPYGAPPKPPKKKARWILPVVAIVVVAAIVLFLVFGTGLFGSTKSKWEKAEREAFKISEGEALFPFKQAMNYFSQAEKAGFISDISMNIDIPDMDLDIPVFIEAISNLRLHLEGATDSSGDDLLFETTIGLGAKGSTSESLSATIYNASEHLVIEIPDIVDRPLLIPYEEIEYDMDFDLGMSSGAMKKMRELMEPFTGDNLDKIINDVLDIFFKNADKPVLEKGKSVTVEGITEKFDQYTVELKKDKLIDFMKDLLQYAKKNNDIKTLVESMMAMQDDVELDIDGIIDKAIEEIEKEREGFDGGIRRILYVNGKNQPCGWSLIAYQGEGEDEVEGAAASWMHVQEGDRHACSFSAVMEAGYSGVEIVSTYEESKDKAKTGELTIYQSSFGEKEEILTVKYRDLSFAWKNPMLIFEGEIEVSVPMGGGDEMNVKIGGSAAEKGGKPYQILNITLEGNVNDNTATFELQTETHIPPASDINLGKRSLPANGVNISDPYEMQELFSDPAVMQKIQTALSELGIDVGEFFPSY
ncbi:MAG: hypothetical protein GX924_04490 [Clostridiaceae bacterium]|nr:hypothetical protein [Clostridiaceae bacterium]